MSQEPEISNKVIKRCSARLVTGAPCNSPIRSDRDLCKNCDAKERFDPPSADDAAADPPQSKPIKGDLFTSSGRVKKNMEPLLAENPELADLVSNALDLINRSVSAKTMRAYSAQIEEFTAFCEEVKLSSEIPVSEETLVLFVSHLELRKNKKNGKPLSYGYIASHVYAVGKIHEAASENNPAQSFEVQELLSGIRKKIGTHQAGAYPLLFEDLTSILGAFPDHQPFATNRRALLMLATDPGLKLGGAALAAIDNKAAALKNVRDSDASSEAVLGLDDSFEGFITAKGGRVSRHAVTKLVKDVVAKRDYVSQEKIAGLPKLTETDRQDLAEAAMRPPLIDLRDRAMLLVGYWGGLRGGNIRLLRWRDIRIRDGHMMLHLSRSKHDKEGEGHTQRIPRALDPTLCAVTAIGEYKHAIQVDAGRIVHPDAWVFPGVRPTKQQADSTINKTLTKLLHQAGLPTSYSPHSLRSGIVVELLLAGVHEEKIRDHIGWKTTKEVSRYGQWAKEFRGDDTFDPLNGSRFGLPTEDS